MIPVALLLAACIVAETARELCFKRASGALVIAVEARSWLRTISNYFLWLGVAIWGAETLAWIAVLERVPLGIAYPLTAITYALTPLLGWALLSERLSAQQIAGVLLVTIGAGAIGFAGV